MGEIDFDKIKFKKYVNVINNIEDCVAIAKEEIQFEKLNAIIFKKAEPWKGFSASGPAGITFTQNIKGIISLQKKPQKSRQVIITMVFSHKQLG